MSANEEFDGCVFVCAQVKFVGGTHVARRSVEGGEAVRERHALRTLKRVAVAARIRKRVVVIKLPVRPHVKTLVLRSGLQKLVCRKNALGDTHVVDHPLERQCSSSTRAYVKAMRIKTYIHVGMMMRRLADAVKVELDLVRRRCARRIYNHRNMMPLPVADVSIIEALAVISSLGGAHRHHAFVCVKIETARRVVYLRTQLHDHAVAVRVGLCEAFDSVGLYTGQTNLPLGTEVLGGPVKHRRAVRDRHTAAVHKVVIARDIGFTICIGTKIPMRDIVRCSGHRRRSGSRCAHNHQETFHSCILLFGWITHI